MAELPSGAITFLFTDIEGSTRLVKQLRELYGEVLAEHQRLLRAAFAAHGGHEVDTQGDSFFVAFASAREALLAAVEAQLALLSHPWPEGVEIKVRMGLHTGQAVASERRYTGLAVHRAARICAAGHGGQVLVSQATQTLLEDEEEDLHIFFRDLGQQQLKDLDRPVHLYQAAADGLPAAFPPVRSEGGLVLAEPAAVVPLWRRPAALVTAALALAAVVGVAVVLTTRGSGGGLSGVRANHVGLIDPATNQVAAEIAAGIRPGPVAVGGGTIWVGNIQDRTLTRIDAAQRSAAGTIPLGGRTPTGIAVGAGGVWVAHGRGGQLSRVDPQFNQVTATIAVAGTPFTSQEGAVAVGEGSVWAVFGDSTFARVEPATVRLAGSTLVGSAPAAVVVGSGSVWVANAEDATVQRFHPTTFRQGPLRTISVGRRPTAIAFGEGAIWVANRNDDTVTRIDPSTSGTTTIPVGDGPVALAVGAGAVWVANAAAGTVSRIDPASSQAVEIIHVGNAPSGIAVGEGFVWVAAQAP